MIDQDKEHLIETTYNDHFEQNIHPKLFDEEFTDSKDCLFDIINFLPDATFVIDSTGHVIAWNKAMEELTNTKADQMLGKGGFQYSIPFYGERRRLLIDLVTSAHEETEGQYNLFWRKKGFITAETFIPSLKGRPTYLWGKASPFYNHKGKVVGAIESIRDVTEKKEAEKELERHRDHLKEMVEEKTTKLKKINNQLQMEVIERKRIEKILKQSEEKYRNIFENAGIGIFQSTLDEKFISVNPAMAHILGYESPQEVINSIHDIGKQIYAEPERRFRVLDMLQENHGIIKVENEYRRKDGKKRIANLTLRAVRDDKDSILYYEGFMEDITQRKQAEEALKDSEERYRNIVETSQAGVFLIDAENNTSYVNQRMAEMLGYKNVKEILGRNFSDFVDQEGQKKALRFLKRRKQKIREVNEFKFLCSDGSEVWTLISANPLFNQKDKYIGALGVVTDITARKGMEKALIERQNYLRLVTGNMMDAITHLTLKESCDVATHKSKLS